MHPWHAQCAVLLGLPAYVQPTWPGGLGLSFCAQMCTLRPALCPPVDLISPDVSCQATSMEPRHVKGSIIRSFLESRPCLKKKVVSAHFSYHWAINKGPGMPRCVHSPEGQGRPAWNSDDCDTPHTCKAKSCASIPPHLCKFMKRMRLMQLMVGVLFVASSVLMP